MCNKIKEIIAFAVGLLAFSLLGVLIYYNWLPIWQTIWFIIKIPYLIISFVGCFSGFPHCSVHNTPDFPEFQKNIETQLFGQPFIKPTVLNTLKAHLLYEYPDKPLVMSFNGCTGCGKNFVSQIIIDNMYQAKKACVHKFNSEIDFKHKNEINVYISKLQSLFHAKVSFCPRSIFIFDEVDHMPEELVDAIKPYLGTEPSIHGVDYRKAIFIFLSNVGASEISHKVYEAHTVNRSRNDLRLSEMQEVIELLYRKDIKSSISALVKSVDFLVPFLPLEEQHVRECVAAEMRRLFKTDFAVEIIGNRVVEELEWYPPVEHLFSSSGCKKIAKKLQLLV